MTAPIRSNCTVQDLGQVAHKTIHSLNNQEIELQENETGAWHMMRVRPYKTWDNKIDGAVISFQDIDAMKRNLGQARRFADSLIENAHEAILVLDGSLRVISANRAFCREFRVLSEQTENCAIYDLGGRQWNIPKLRELLEDILPNNGRVENFEVR